MDDFCSFFRLTNAYKLIHSDTCSCSEPFLGLYYLKCPSFSSVILCLLHHRSFLHIFNLWSFGPSELHHTPGPFLLFCFWHHDFPQYMENFSTAFILFLNVRVIHISTVFVLFIVLSKPAYSKHLLNETKQTQCRINSRIWKEFKYQIGQVLALCFILLHPLQEISVWISLTIENSGLLKTSIFRKLQTLGSCFLCGLLVITSYYCNYLDAHSRSF